VRGGSGQKFQPAQDSTMHMRGQKAEITFEVI